MRLPARPFSPRAVAMVLGLLGALAGAWFADALSPSQAPAASPFQWRGVIQAQYGPQFSPAQRRRLLRFMAANGFNARPRAEGRSHQRTLWRDPYPPARQAALDSELRLAAQLGIKWIPNVSPAEAKYSSPGDAAPPGTSPSAPVCFSSETDLQQLLAKLQPFREAGATAFMLSFDDVQCRFSCDSDVATYGKGPHAFGLATADLLDHVYQRLLAGDPSAQLLTVPSAYHGTRDNSYLSGFRERLTPGIDVMWTGPAVTSRPFGTADADSYGGLVGRAPVVWENWTANDMLTAPGRQPARIFLGPYSRPAKLAGHVGGFFFNLANQADLNFLPLATAGDWLQHPASYRPRRAFLRETRMLAGSQAPFLRAFAEANYSTTLRRSVEAPTLRRLIQRFLGARGLPTQGARRCVYAISCASPPGRDAIWAGSAV